MAERQPPPEPHNGPDLARWLADHGLDGAEVLTVIPTEELERLSSDELRLLHGLLEARWQLDHPNPED
jgi:hypothetical protein